MEDLTTGVFINKATIYYQTDFGFGVSKREVKNLEIKEGKYAQYDKALHFRYVPKGKRKLRGFVKTDNDFVVVLEGWGHPEPTDGFAKEKESETGITTQSSRHTCFSPEYIKEFKALIIPYLESKQIKPIIERMK